MRKCEEYRIQQKVKKDKKLGLREICGFTERRLVFGCDDMRIRKSHKKYKKKYKKRFEDQEKYNKNYNPYYNKYKRKKFKKFRNTSDTRKRFRNKRKFRRKPYTKRKISECTCWNCNEKGHYANKCPKLKEKRVKYINTSEFIMNLEQFKEDNNNWHEYEEFYIRQTDDESEPGYEDISKSESEQIEDSSSENNSE